MPKTKEYYETEMAIMSDAITFSDVKRLKAIQDAELESQDLLFILSILIDRIIEQVEPELRMEKITEAINEYLVLVRPLIEARNNPDISERGSVKSVLDKYDVPAAESQKLKSGNGIVVWKVKEADTYRWLTVYSNNFLDNDNPPEIISERSQRTFVKMVDENIVPYPEFWSWHVEGSRMGVADLVDYTNGFAVASGVFDPGMEAMAKNLSEMDDLLVSHGMYPELIGRDPNNPHIITFHVTKEISPLPSGAAANKRTGFVVLEKGRDMSDVDKGLDPKKVQHLQDVGFNSNQIMKMEDLLKEAQAEADEQNVPSKEQSEEDGTKENQDSPSVTREEIAATLAEVIKPIIEANTTLTARVVELESSVKELNETDATRIANLKEETPAASLDSLVADLLFNDNSRENGNTKLGRMAPKETSTIPSTTGNPIIDGILDGGVL